MIRSGGNTWRINSPPRRPIRQVMCCHCVGIRAANVGPAVDGNFAVTDCICYPGDFPLGFRLPLDSLAKECDRTGRHRDGAQPV